MEGLGERLREAFLKSLSEDQIHAMSVDHPSAMLDPEGAQSTAAITDISGFEDLSLSDKKMELHEDIEENICSEKQTGSSEQHFGGAHPKEYSRSMGTDPAIPGEKLEHCEETEESKYSRIQMHTPQQNFGGARPKEYRREIRTLMGADQAVPRKKLKHCEDTGESKCSEIKINFPERNFGGARPKEYRRDMGAEQAVPGDKLELCQEMKEIKCPEVQMHISEKHFGGAHPIEYCRDMGANQEIPGEKLEHCKGMEESQCSGIQIDSPEQHFGAHPKDDHGGLSAAQAIPSQDVPKKYYAVSFPTEDFIIKDNPLIYEQKKDALQAIQQNPGARFREFTSRREAHQYASIPYETQVPSSISEANLTFKTLSKQELVQFEKCIGTGDMTYLLELVWSNPRYLINKNDYPTIIQEEIQANALHSAAIHGQLGIFVQILHILQDSQFMSILHPKDEPSKIQARIRCLVGFYLNMTDKVLCETPLHFACRFGHRDIVQIILAFSESLIKNKLDKSIGDIICQSHDCSPNHKRSVFNLFTDMYYVPIVQDEVCKYVDIPCNAQTVLAAMTTHPVKLGSPAIYCAFAGPAPYIIAKKFYQHLKKSKFIFLKAPPNVVLASAQKRIEKEGRKLSKKYRIGWIEYWRSLDAWLDISSSTGLKFLEKHLNKLDIQINFLPDKYPLFLDIINNFMEEFVVKIPEIAVTSDKLSLFHVLQTLVLCMDCFIKYPFSNEIKVFEIHEELGHILYLKLTEDNHKNRESFQILKLLLLSQFSYVTCYQKSIWKMFCCILRFASYFQQGSEFVVKPACQCDFALVEDLYVYSSKSCYFKLLSWRQGIINELVQKYEAMFENPQLEERETPSIPLSSDVCAADHDDFAVDICTLEQYIQLYGMDDVHMYKKYYLQSSTFIFVFCTLILKSYNASKTFIEIFQNVIKSWEPICKLHYQQDINLASIHYELAFCLFVQFYNIPIEIVQWCKIHLRREISSVASTSHEWTHLMCVTTLFLSMLESKKCDTTCECQYYIDPTTESVHPSNCITLLQRLRRQLIISKLQTEESQMRSSSVESEEERGRVTKRRFSDKEEVYATPPDSSPIKKAIYVEGNTFSDEDIGIYHALVEARVDISNYHYILKWKSLVKNVLGNTY